MSETLLQLVQDAQTELGLPTSSSVIRALDNSGRQFGGLATRCGRLLLRVHDWSFLTREWRITLPAPMAVTCNVTQGSMTLGGIAPGPLGQLSPNNMVVTGAGMAPFTRLTAIDHVALTATIDQPATASGTGVSLSFLTDTFPEPADYFRPVSQTHWDRAMHWPMSGPLTPQEDQWLRSGVVSSGPRRKYRALDHAIRIWPAPAGGSDTNTPLVSEYVSANWVTSAAGVGQPRFLADGDVCGFDDGLMVLGIKYLFFQIKGFASDDLKEQWTMATRNAIASDGPRRTLNMGATGAGPLVSPSNIQDGNVPGPGNP